MEASRTKVKDLASEPRNKVQELKQKYKQWAEKCGVVKGSITEDN